MEIKYHSPARRNALGADGHRQLGEIVNSVQNDVYFKCIVIHGGNMYCSGNDLADMVEIYSMNKEQAKETLREGIYNGMIKSIEALKNSIKPVICVVAGPAVGIGFTQLCHA